MYINFWVLLKHIYNRWIYVGMDILFYEFELEKLKLYVHIILIETIIYNI